MKIRTAVWVLAATAAMWGAESLVAGKWKIQASAGGRESERVCTLVEKQGEIDGSCVVGKAAVAVKGKVEGRKVSFRYQSESEAGPMTVVFQGTVDGATMKGTVTAVEFSIDGEFSGTRVQ